ncbi:AAA family ATPase [Allopontixanthobacter sediminis]|uniref:AAA family ATPase n=1 Tax=Allopontixanthobacter sediminis TaxID=1689985 RepID=A0A845AYE5_9SPHN|nr:AAA family ATPase [Allopontixanthobacter sediminis]MXP42968.1 AAA family ATPase [Allopontixanthobacter sediminis]
MATDSNTALQFGPAWCSRQVPTFSGMHDTHIEDGDDYSTITLADIFTMPPGDHAKGAGPAFIPSSYFDFDARKHASQRAKGSFVALCGDIDSGDHSLERIKGLMRGFSGKSACLIYSSAHARAGDMRWRIILPLETPVSFDDWHDAQHAFFDFMEEHGVEMDRALDRAGQPVYLPNVPAAHAKSGTRLRDEDGKPLYYDRATTGCNAPGLDITTGPIAVAIADIFRKRAADERDRERIRAEAMERRANKPQTEGGPVMEEFNKSNSIATLFEMYGYEQSPRNPDDWRSPKQTSDSYATRIMGDTWVSLSASDVGARLGAVCKAGCFGDAYDLFVHYEHGGDHKSAFRALYAERRTSAPVSAPPPVDADDPGWTEPPHDDDTQPEDVFMASVPDELAEEKPELDAVDAFDFNEADIPTRPWVIPGVILSGYTHMLAAPGGSGKSLFTLQIAIALARGLPWGAFVPRRKCRTLIINVEDDIDEQRRRLSAARTVMQGGDELRGMIDLVPDAATIVVAGRSPDGRTIRTMPIVETLVEYIQRREIDVLIVDPFAETFEGDENDNSEVKWAMKIWRDEIARRTGCAVYLVHHTVKHAGGGAGDANVIRGAGAIVNSTRISATLMPMTSEDAEMIGVDQAERHLYVRYDDAKANQSLKTNTARWFEKVSVTIGNGDKENPSDEVGALVPWIPPDAFDNLTGNTIKIILDKVEAGLPSGERYTGSGRGGSKESGRWVGCLIMAEAGLTEPHAKKVAGTWIANGVMVEEEYHCPVARRKKKGLFAPEKARPGEPK